MCTFTVLCSTFNKPTIVKPCPQLNEAGRTERMPYLCTMESKFFVHRGIEWGSVKTNGKHILFGVLTRDQQHWWTAFILLRPVRQMANCSFPRLHDISISVCPPMLIRPCSQPHLRVDATLHKCETLSNPSFLPLLPATTGHSDSARGVVILLLAQMPLAVTQNFLLHTADNIYS